MSDVTLDELVAGQTEICTYGQWLRFMGEIPDPATGRVQLHFASSIGAGDVIIYRDEVEAKGGVIGNLQGVRQSA
jgi:hypothetical protein